MFAKIRFSRSFKVSKIYFHHSFHSFSIENYAELQGPNLECACYHVKSLNGLNPIMVLLGCTPAKVC